MPERTVNTTLVSYLDEDGVRRYGLHGETVSVHPDHVEAFDEANGIVTVQAPTKAAPKKAAPKKG
jgi:hypothetical protein